MAKRKPTKVSTSASTKSSNKKDCPHCSGGAETFRYFGGTYKFDVDRARQIVGDGRDAIELALNDVKYSVDMCRIYPDHLEHVDVQFPGIIAHVWGPGAGGKWLHGHLLIDGHHRAARCLQLKVPYRVYLLSEEESEAILLRGPGSVPPKKKPVAPRRKPAKRVAAKKKTTSPGRRRTVVR